MDWRFERTITKRGGNHYKNEKYFCNWCGICWRSYYGRSSTISYPKVDGTKIVSSGDTEESLNFGSSRREEKAYHPRTPFPDIWSQYLHNSFLGIRYSQGPKILCIFSSRQAERLVYGSNPSIFIFNANSKCLSLS